jgi:phosphatidylinositol glycan class Z
MRGWIFYAVCALIRILLAFSPAYIHPDEHFQSTEVSAALMGGCGTIPWEFADSTTPYRSLMPP